MIEEYGPPTGFTSDVIVDIANRTGVGISNVGSSGRTAIDETPSTQASYFLSYSHKNTLVARQLYEDLGRYPGVDIWFDLAHHGEVPTHDNAITDWLRSEVHKSHGFLLLLTKAAAGSEWVTKEIEWAKQRSVQPDSFELIVLKLESVELPVAATDGVHVIDCDGLWWSNGLNEEVHGALFGHESRREWADEQRRRGFKVPDENYVINYEDFESDAGSAVGLSWTVSGDDLRWEFVYDRDGQRQIVTGSGAREPIDLDIQAGDRVGFFLCHRYGGRRHAGPLNIDAAYPQQGPRCFRDTRR
jgi:hypothetical protein